MIYKFKSKAAGDVIIGLGTVLGAILEKSGGAQALTAKLLGIFGERGAPVAMGLLGLIYGLLSVAGTSRAPLRSARRSVFGRLGSPMLNEQAEAGIQAMSDQLKRRLDLESDVLFGTARLWDDGIIDPRDTRNVLALCLAMARDARARVLHPNTFGVARI